MPQSILINIINKNFFSIPFFTALKGFFKEIRFLLKLKKRRFTISFTLFPGGLGNEKWLQLFLGIQKRVGPMTIGYTHMVDWDNSEHVVENNLDLLRALGKTVKKMPLSLSLCGQHLAEADKFLEIHDFNFGEEIAVGMHPSVSLSRQRWPVERFAAIAKHLTAKPGIRVLVFAGPQEEAVYEYFTDIPIIKVCRLPFPTVCGIIRQCHSMFTSDTGLGHIAAAMAITTVTIYGNTNLNKYRHWGNIDISINKLQPAQYPGISENYYAGNRGKQAVLNVSIEEVIAIFDKLLPNGPASEFSFENLLPTKNQLVYA